MSNTYFLLKCMRFGYDKALGVPKSVIFYLAKGELSYHRINPPYAIRLSEKTSALRTA